MLNLELGSPQDKDGRSRIVTRKGVTGHAVYGPYELLEPGRYAVRFTIELAEGDQGARDHRCAVIDVASNTGNSIHVRKEIFASALRDGPATFTLKFDVKTAARLEYRVWTSGRAALLIDDYRPVVPAGDASAIAGLLAARTFPETGGEHIPFFRDHRAQLRSLYEEGIGVSIHDDAVVLAADGVLMFAREADDLNFVGEVLREKVYDFHLTGPVSVIDVGLNIGLSSLLLAGKAEVVEINSYEPFRATFDRAMANLELNPAAAAKIRAWDYGLSDHDHEDTILVAQTADSGGMSTVGAVGGIPIHVTLRDAGAVLEPIILAAHARGEKVVAKIDCEGSEFAIFRSLAARGLLGRISAFMVEWHAMHQDMDQNTLIRPLEQAGFMVFDRSPPIGNGFFYAVKVAEPAA